MRAVGLLCEGFGGLWNGVPLTEVNKGFLEDVERAFDGQKDTRIVVTCSQGLRYSSSLTCFVSVSVSAV